MMQAVQYFSYGGGPDALKLSEVPVPKPKENDILVKVEAASLNPIDWRIQEGILRAPKLLSILPLPIPFVDCKFPFTPGVEVAGEVIDVGTNVKTVKKGDKVVSLLNFLNGGGLAQYAIAESFTAVRPSGSCAAEYAGLPVAGVTALQILKSIGAKFDGTGGKHNILITAASGGVGLYLVQLARLAGLHVTATCGARNMDLVRSLGANEVLDYKTPEGQQLASPSGKLYDSVINCVPNTEWSSTLEANLTSDGKVIEVTPTPVTMARYWIKKLVRSNKLEVFMLKSDREDLEFMIKLVNQGSIRTVLDSTYALDKAEEAWKRCMSGHATGKIIVEM
ncbi:hypothetical protein LUZ63_014045 [Rhynchospora breviuscula]|uniref:Enoyl reductase (ER) domain-containing protein n=1 Tax=Rhynchospora breviuscula TaxID=2022672 RepID=A0A9Q0C9Q1_9POAL|nr:hypothetical protein LUZ63_014045 [Rhynchospora breviuscula]